MVRRPSFFEMFRATDDWQNNACLNWLNDQWFGYAEGYRQGAEILVNYVCESHRDQDKLVYPICFLYRQYLELVLKRIIELGFAFAAKDKKPTLGHNLQRLWKESKSLVFQVWPDGDDSELSIIETAVNEFHAIDGQGQGFRYTQDTRGNKSLGDIRHINLRHLRDSMEPVSNLLYGIAMGIEHAIDSRSEQNEG